MHHLSFVKRKPEPLGVELNTVCDCTTGASCCFSLVFVSAYSLRLRSVAVES